MYDHVVSIARSGSVFLDFSVRSSVCPSVRPLVRSFVRSRAMQLITLVEQKLQHSMNGLNEIKRTLKMIIIFVLAHLVHRENSPFFYCKLFIVWLYSNKPWNEKKKSYILWMPFGQKGKDDRSFTHRCHRT